MADIFEGIKQGVAAPFKILGAARAGMYDPYGEQRQARQQNIQMNKMNIQAAKMDAFTNALNQVASDADGLTPDERSFLVKDFEQDPDMQEISKRFGGIERLIDLKAKVVQQAQQITEQERQTGAEQNLLDLYQDKYNQVGDPVFGQIAANRGFNAGLGPVTPEYMAGQRNIAPDTDYDVYTTPDGRSVAINMNDPSVPPIETQLPTGATRASTSRTSIDLGEKTPPQYLAQGIAQITDVQSDLLDIEAMLEPGEGGLESVGLWDSAIQKYLKQPTGMMSEKEQRFVQKFTQLQRLLRILNGETRMSDQDYLRLKDSLPGQVLKDKTFKSAIAGMREDNQRKLKRYAGDMEAYGFKVPPSAKMFIDDSTESGIDSVAEKFGF